MSGALFALVLHIGLSAVVDHIRKDKEETAAATTPAERTATARQKLNRLKRSLKAWPGWQYPIRLVFCLGLVSVAHVALPRYDLHWAALTLALPIERRPERMPLKTTQRVVGVLVGVGCAGLLSFTAMPVWADVLSVAILGGARPFLRARNYLAYSIVVTPLMMMAMGTADHVIPATVLWERLWSTVFAACLVILVNQVAILLLPEKGRQSA